MKGPDSNRTLSSFSSTNSSHTLPCLNFCVQHNAAGTSEDGKPIISALYCQREDVWTTDVQIDSYQDLKTLCFGITHASSGSSALLLRLWSCHRTWRCGWSLRKITRICLTSQPHQVRTQTCPLRNYNEAAKDNHVAIVSIVRVTSLAKSHSVHFVRILAALALCSKEVEQ